MTIDILAIGAHPDDVELGCGGTILSHIAQGLTVGILDLTHGELGTRGTGELRLQEAKNAATLLGIKVRHNLGLADGFFQNDKATQLLLIQYIRQYRPSIILTNAIHDRHPDHARSAQLTEDAAFLSGLSKVTTIVDGVAQQPHRPMGIYHYIQALDIEAQFAVDISEYYEQKVAAVMAYQSQFYDPTVSEPNTFISSPEFLEFVKGRASHWGVPLGVRYAEGFTSKRHLGIKDLRAIL